MVTYLPDLIFTLAHNGEMINDNGLCRACDDAKFAEQQKCNLEELPANYDIIKCQGTDKTMMERPALVIPRTTQRGGIDVTQTWRELFARHHSRAKRRSARKNENHTRPRGPVTSEGHQANEQPLGEVEKLPLRLGKSQLGKYADEEQMPAWLVRLLVKESGVRTDGIIPTLGKLLVHSPSTQLAYLCHPQVAHVSKLRREGGFCGYRNIQVLISHIISMRVPGWERFGETLPNILQIQDMIEKAWDEGYNSQGRTETGGIRGTRKYIGTPEAQALFSSLGFPCCVQAFRDVAGQSNATDVLFQAVENYFQRGSRGDINENVRSTVLPPIYLQQPGHSVTIVGLERQKCDEVQLLVLDPAFQGSNMVTRVVNKSSRYEKSAADKLLKPYRRSASQLRKFSEFEILFLTSSTVNI